MPGMAGAEDRAGVGCGTAALYSRGHYRLFAFRGNGPELHIQRTLEKSRSQVSTLI
jgi:hypothetical protein